MAAGDPISGKDGTIKTGATPAEIYQVGNWKITTAANVSKFATNSSGGWKRAVAGAKEWSGSWDQKIDDGNAMPVKEGDSVDVQLHIDGSDGQYYSGTAVVESIDGPEVDINDGAEIGYTVNFQGDGTLTRTGAMLTAS